MMSFTKNWDISQKKAILKRFIFSESLIPDRYYLFDTTSGIHYHLVKNGGISLKIISSNGHEEEYVGKSAAILWGQLIGISPDDKEFAEFIFNSYEMARKTINKSWSWIDEATFERTHPMESCQR